jgi:hypothetical protein
MGRNLAFISIKQSRSARDSLGRTISISAIVTVTMETSFCKLGKHLIPQRRAIYWYKKALAIDDRQMPRVRDTVVFIRGVHICRAYNILF